MYLQDTECVDIGCVLTGHRVCRYCGCVYRTQSVWVLWMYLQDTECVGIVDVITEHST